MSADELAEYLTNLRAMLTENEARYAIMVERQVQVGLLPKLSGTRAQLESQLWSLLILCLDGHAAPVPANDTATWERAQAAALAGQSQNATPARFPRAAKAVCTVLQVLREVGIYPKPKLKTG